MSKAPRCRPTKDHRRQVFQVVRIGDLTKLFGHRYGGGKLYQFPDDDAGREDLRILLDHYSYSNPLAIPRVIKARAPWLVGVEWEYLLEGVNRFPRIWTAQALALKLNLTEVDRRGLGIRTIGAVDMTPAERKQQRKLRDRQRQRDKRRARGATPRESSKSRLKPWEALGMSRPTFYRKFKKPRETDTSAMNLEETGDEVVSPSQQADRFEESRGRGTPKAEP